MPTRAFIRFLEVSLGFTLSMLQLESMKDNVSSTGMIIMNTIFTSTLPTVMLRFEVLLYGKIGFSKIEDMSFCFLGTSIYTVGGAYQYRYMSQYLNFYKTCGSLIMAFLFFVDLVVTWCSAAEDDLLLQKGVFCLIVPRQDLCKVKDVRLQEHRMPMTAPTTKIDPDPHYHRPRFMRPWGKVYFRDCDDEVAEDRLEEILRKGRKKKGKEAVTPQERLLRAIELKRELANALREQRIERAARTISQNPSYK